MIVRTDAFVDRWLEEVKKNPALDVEIETEDDLREFMQYAEQLHKEGKSLSMTCRIIGEV